MAWTLGSLTLPAPQGFERQQIEVQRDNVMLDGSTKRDIVTKKERFILIFEKLTQSEVTGILTEYTKNTAVDFAVTETNLTIASTSVLVSMQARRYSTPGNEYREDLELILEEVS